VNNKPELVLWKVVFFIVAVILAIKVVLVEIDSLINLFRSLFP
jgi:hypothetical protein